MIRLRGWVVVTLMVLFGGRAIASEPNDAEGLIAKLKASLGAIQTVQGTYRTYFSPKTPGTDNSIEPDGHPVPGAIAGPDGQVLYSEFDWAWQAAPYREAIDGKWGYVQENRMIYTTAAFFFDGGTLRTFSRDSKGGLIKPLDDTFTVWRNPLHLDRHWIRVRAPTRSRRAARRRRARLAAGHAPTHQGATERVPRLRPGSRADRLARYDARLPAAPNRGFREGSPVRHVADRQRPDRSRLPRASGWRSAGPRPDYYVADFILPGGMTKDRLKTLARDALGAVLGKAEVVPGTLGLGTQT